MISVIMGVHAVDDYLLDAIESVLKQTLKDIEVVIVANGSQCEIISNFINSNVKDDRVFIYKSKIPQLAHALNIAIDNAKYDYIARMDSDDISDPNRLEKQLAFMVENDLDMVGTDAILIDKNANEIGSRITPKGDLIDLKIKYKNCFIHPSVLYKKSTILSLRGYNSGFNSEDYDLWLRMRRAGVRWDNMPEFLLKYRIHSQASQRQLLGYAECTGYALREFVIEKNLSKLFAVFYFLIKSFFRAK